MDMVKISPSTLRGEVTVPPSKSYAHRGIIGAFLSGEKTVVENISMSQDILATISCIKELGSQVNFFDSSVEIGPNSRPAKNKLSLCCNESGSTLRFFVPISLLFAETVEFSGKGRLMERPLSPYFEIFDRQGINYSSKDGVLTISGKLHSGDFVIDGSISSQFITGLLFALPLLDGDSRILIENGLSSKGYIDITLDVLKDFGIDVINEDYKSFYIKGNQKYKARTYHVEGDFSQAAFFLTAGALGGDILCKGLSPESLQGDRKILEIIEAAGGKIEKVGSSSFRVSGGELQGISVDADEIPDLVPILSVLFAYCNGESRIENAGRLRIKESDRLSAITKELSKMGADIVEGEDFLVIRGKSHLYGANTQSHNDHRISMAISIAALRAEGEVTIEEGRNSVKKSYPDFFEDYKILGGKAE